jgi:hypothetical protein
VAAEDSIPSTVAQNEPTITPGTNIDSDERPYTYRLEANDNPGGDPKVILRTASELRQQVVSLYYAPRELVGDPGINAASERQRKGRISETRGAIVRSSKE